jgi:hypothetical protein
MKRSNLNNRSYLVARWPILTLLGVLALSPSASSQIRLIPPTPNQNAQQRGPTQQGFSSAATPVAQVLTFNQSIVVGGAATAPATDQKLTVGSFKGFVAIYALNYTGQKLSAKVAGKWLVVNSLSRFQRVVRNTGAAIPIVVDLYIDGKLVRTENIVTK